MALFNWSWPSKKKISLLQTPAEKEIKEIASRLKKYSVNEKQEIMSGVIGQTFTDRRHLHRNPRRNKRQMELTA